MTQVSVEIKMTLHPGTTMEQAHDMHVELDLALERFGMQRMLSVKEGCKFTLTYTEVKKKRPAQHELFGPEDTQYG